VRVEVYANPETLTQVSVSKFLRWGSFVLTIAYRCHFIEILMIAMRLSLQRDVFMSTKPIPVRRAQPDTKTPVGFKAQQAGALTAARIGLILLDSSLKPVYCNSEALRILAYPNQPPKKPWGELTQSIHAIVGNTGARDFSKTLHFVSGRRCYLCRTFILEFESNSDFKATIAITLERRRGLVHDLVALFHLTEREGEVVQHLAEGLRNKEIAQRMNVSTHTVRAFLRLIMIKLDVTTRSAIIGKVLSRRAS